MPLEHGKSKKAFVHNLKTEMDAGKPQKQALAIAYATKKRAKKMAHGGPVGAKYEHEEQMEPAGHESGESAQEEAMEHSADMIHKIMGKRKHYSKGGMVANDVGVSEADKIDAEYDDLVLRDDLSGEQPEDSNEHGDSRVHDDAVDRIMLKRKKDRMPRPA